VQEKILGNTILDYISNSARKIITIICIIISTPSLMISAIMFYFYPITSLSHAVLFLFIALGSAELAYIFSPLEWKGWIRELHDREEEENELHTPSPSEDDVLEYMDIISENSKKQIRCPPCGQKLNIPPSYNGDVSCPVCKGIISIEKGTILL
jgi:hypothetical protein